MIKVTKLNGEYIYINPYNIQWIEDLPNTAITMINNVRFFVKEKPEEIIEKINL